MFRPSDDATIYPFLIPSNLFALSSLRNLRTMLAALSVGKDLDGAAFALENELNAALLEHAIVTHPVFGEVFAYEADGFGNHTFMDDANVPEPSGAALSAVSPL
ncbi:glycoside hydrolase family 125 protein [Puia sp. P3]|uniref:glycoside hydrolase family 125 protein n=1 Tax=Puia sp. P3 TaxID=3423952 RepID=UPI003D67708E